MRLTIKRPGLGKALAETEKDIDRRRPSVIARVDRTGRISFAWSLTCRPGTSPYLWSFVAADDRKRRINRSMSVPDVFRRSHSSKISLFFILNYE